MLNSEFSNRSNQPKGHAVRCMCESNMAEAGENNTEFSFAAAVRGYHVYRIVWLPHLGQHLKAGRELGNAEDHFAIAVYSLGEHSDHTARADDNPSNVFTAKDNSDSWLFGFSIFRSIYT